MFNLVLLLAICPILTGTVQGETRLIEAESFTTKGGWVTDQQSMDQMGSPYLMAHGLGRPVQDATTSLDLSTGGEYRVWVRTRDWAGPWKTNDTPEPQPAQGYPGKFQLLVNGQALTTTFGTEQSAWHWQAAGELRLEPGAVRLALRDLTGFNGRCDAILLSNTPGFTPPPTLDELQALRTKLGVIPAQPASAGEFDLVVVGGGVAGTCAAVSAARHGCRVALVQDRPVLGGNNSSEVRVGLAGLIRQKPYPNLGNLVDEIDPVGHWTLWDAKQNPTTARAKEVVQIIQQHPEKKQHNAGPASNYDDDKKLQVVMGEPNIRLFTNTRINDIEMIDGKIVAAIGQHTHTGKRLRFAGALFADCTGDSNLGAMAGADFRVGREATSETGEELAPEKADQLVMGTSVQWNSQADEKPSTFPATPWAVQFDEQTCMPSTIGDWDWETGARRDQITEIETIRDYALRVTFGNWSVLKNHPKFKQKYAKRKLSWVAYIGGKRESRRLLGDVILAQQDIVDQRSFPDASVTTTWTIDLHYPKKPTCACEAFRSEAHHLKITPYPIPYRCLYSRNVPNLLLAGRNISVTHVALGTVRVQRTTGMMGEVVGMAAGICKLRSTTPRGVYQHHLDELIAMMQQGVPAAGPGDSR